MDHGHGLTDELEENISNPPEVPLSMGEQEERRLEVLRNGGRVVQRRSIYNELTANKTDESHEVNQSDYRLAFRMILPLLGASM
jgi:hypothetical protein